MALGRKNWLFAGSDRGGHHAAAIASLVATARLNGLDPEAYLRDVLERIAEHPSTASPNSCPGTSSREAPQRTPPDHAPNCDSLMTSWVLHGTAASREAARR